MLMDRLNHVTRHSRWYKLLINDGLKIVQDQLAAIERCQRLSELQRIDEHGHAARGPSARDGELDSGFPQTRDGFYRALRQHFLLRDEGSIDIRYHHSDRLSRLFIFRCHL